MASWAALNAAGRGPLDALGAPDRATEEARDAENAARYEKALRHQQQHEVGARSRACFASCAMTDDEAWAADGPGQGDLRGAAAGTRGCVNGRPAAAASNAVARGRNRGTRGSTPGSSTCATRTQPRLSSSGARTTRRSRTLPM